MLKKRILSVLVLLVILGITLLPGQQKLFPIFLGLIATISIWEWLCLTVPTFSSKLLSFILSVISFSGMLWINHCMDMDPIVPVAIFSAKFVTLIWLFFVVPALIFRDVKTKSKNLIWSFFCIPAHFTCWLLLAIASYKQGPWFVLSLLALVWISDTSAYFLGKKFGKRKLALEISSGKTLIGAFGSIIGSVIWIFISYPFNGTYSHILVQKWSFSVTVLIAVILGMLSIIGDLFGSLLKRRFGCKNSGNFLPGHGGFYDRIDSALPVVPIAILLIGELF